MINFEYFFNLINIFRYIKLQSKFNFLITLIFLTNIFSIFSQEELADRSAAIDWTKGALKDGDSERSILMQLQTTGWSAPQSRAIIDLSKQ